MSQLLAIKADFNEIPDKILILRFGKPEKAIKSLDDKTEPYLSQAIVQWHMTRSAIPALTLMRNAPYFLKNFYLTILAQKL